MNIEFTIESNDVITPQYFALYDVYEISGAEIAFRFEIVDVYAGSKYDDVCLSVWNLICVF